MEWKNVESKQSPELVDATSCPGKVYVRKDVKEITHDEESYYEYQEALMTQEEYQSYSGQKIEGTGTNDNQTVIMSALADIADMILDMQMGGE